MTDRVAAPSTALTQSTILLRPSADRFALGFVSARGFGAVFTLSSVVNLALPHLDRIVTFWPMLLGLVVMTVGYLMLGRIRTVVLAAAVYAAGLATTASFLLPGTAGMEYSTLATVTTLSSAAVPSVLVAIADRRGFLLITVLAIVPVMALAVVASLPSGRAFFVALAVVFGWVAVVFIGLWLARSVRRAEAGVERLRQGYADERRSTEREADLRYGARVLHDTVLATLTVLAHSGVGTPAEALRKQAASDGRLLEQLRTRGVLGLRPEQSGPLDASAPLRQPTPTRELHETVDRWCRECDFSVAWYGDDTVDAAEAERDALVRAALASLSNARRHSGERLAEITISHSELVVRAVVTDTGVGFDRALVPPGRLGVAESIEARMAAVGGSARVFTSPGRGTTVLLEVPR